MLGQKEKGLANCILQAGQGETSDTGSDGC
jgi:hypothetical protein